ncbi:hypothetical protein KA005_72300, partial [bacterium]|nr:hypothetical protein [bacterium]
MSNIDAANNDNLPFGNGRIADIITFLKAKYHVQSVEELSTKQKLDVLCEVLQLSYDQFDSIIADNPQVLRAIKGHVFEIVFEYILSNSGHKLTCVGGDSNIDLIVNEFTLQLKSPYKAGTIGNIVQYKTHKTHGPKSEEESVEYYHSVDDFADYLVGLIFYVPLNIIFLKKSELPTHPRDTNRIISPFSVEWKGHPGLNAFDRIGIKQIDLSPTVYLCTDSKNELLPRSTQELLVKTDIILDAILHEGNFRIWDMLIRGFARERYFKDYLNSNHIKIYKPTECRRSRGDKADLAL